jgi:hypothetical protein
MQDTGTAIKFLQTFAHRGGVKLLREFVHRDIVGKAIEDIFCEFLCAHANTIIVLEYWVKVGSTGNVIGLTGQVFILASE